MSRWVGVERMNPRLERLSRKHYLRLYRLHGAQRDGSEKWAPYKDAVRKHEFPPELTVHCLSKRKRNFWLGY